MSCGFPYCGGVDCADCHKPRCNAIEYCNEWPSCNPACPLSTPECPSVPGAVCVGAECAAGCVRTRGTAPPAEQRRQVGWLTQAGNVVTPVGNREQDAKLYGWKAVFEIIGAAGVPVGYQSRDGIACEADANAGVALPDGAQR